jgi:hypothetical protein
MKISLIDLASSPFTLLNQLKTKALFFSYPKTYPCILIWRPIHFNHSSFNIVRFCDASIKGFANFVTFKTIEGIKIVVDDSKKNIKISFCLQQKVLNMKLIGESFLVFTLCGSRVIYPCATIDKAIA